MLFGPSMAAQKYGPPLVGTAETISAIPKPTNIATAVGSLLVIRFVASETNVLKKLTTIHPTDMTPGPPVFRPYWKSLSRVIGGRVNGYARGCVRGETCNNTL